MKRFLILKTGFILLSVGWLMILGCNADLITQDEVSAVQETFESPSSNRSIKVTIIGTILDPVSRAPVVGATVKIGDIITTTKSNGKFAVSLGNITTGLIVNVTALNHVDFIFPVSFDESVDGSLVNWDIELPRLQPSIPFEPGFDSYSTFNYDGVTYTVKVPADISNTPTTFTVGPGGTVVGTGISGVFAVVGIDFEDDQNGLSDEDFDEAENYILSSPVSITYNPLDAVLTRGIGSYHPAASEEDATPGAQTAAKDVEDAIDAAQAAISNRARSSEIAAIFIAELYGLEVEEVQVNANGTVTVENCIEGTLQPGTCLLYTSPSPRDLSTSRMPSSA